MVYKASSPTDRSSKHIHTRSLTWIRVGWVALKEYSRSSIAKHTIDNIGVACDPAYVSHTGKNVRVWVVIKGILNGEREKGSIQAIDSSGNS